MRPTKKNIDELAAKLAKVATDLHEQKKLTEEQEGLAKHFKEQNEAARVRIQDLVNELAPWQGHEPGEITRLRNALQCEKDLNRQLQAKVDDKFQLPPMAEFEHLKSKCENQRQIIARQEDELRHALQSRESIYQKGLVEAQLMVLHSILKKGIDRIQGGELPADPEPRRPSPLV